MEISTFEERKGGGMKSLKKNAEKIADRGRMCVCSKSGKLC